MIIIYFNSKLNYMIHNWEIERVYGICLLFGGHVLNRMVAFTWFSLAVWQKQRKVWISCGILVQVLWILFSLERKEIGRKREIGNKEREEGKWLERGSDQLANNDNFEEPTHKNCKELFINNYNFSKKAYFST